MSERQQTGSNYSLYYIDLDGIGANSIQTSSFDILTMRLQNIPGGYISYDADQSLFCDVNIEGRSNG
jgi:hypothetical protein